MSYELEADLFALGQGQVTHHARKALEYQLNRHHAQAHDAVLQARECALNQGFGFLQAAQLVIQVLCQFLQVTQLGLGVIGLTLVTQAVQAFAHTLVTNDVGQLATHQDHLADLVHELIEHFTRHADDVGGGIGGRRRCCLGRRGCWFGHRHLGRRGRGRCRWAGLAGSGCNGNRCCSLSRCW